jgi:hypothetical protein
MSVYFDIPMRFSRRKKTEAGALAVMSVLCALLLAMHFRNFSLHTLAIYFAISFAVTFVIAVPWLLMSGRTARQDFARAGLAALLLAAIGCLLFMVADSMGEEGIFLVVIVNIGAVFGLLIIIGLLCLSLLKRRPRGRNRSE